jgi:cytochrome c553
MKKVSIVFAVLVTVMALSCKKDAITTVDCTGVAPTYTSAVKAILDAKCATSGCHGASNPADGLDYSSYTAAKTNGAKDAFRGSIQQLSGYTAMPKGSSKLSDADIKTLNCWVQNGQPQ